MALRPHVAIPTPVRIPYGMAKRIVSAMRVGDVVTARPAFVVPLHNAARRLGFRIATTSFRDGAVLKYRVLRIDDTWESGHLVARIPARDHSTGRWLRDHVGTAAAGSPILKPGVRLLKPLALVRADSTFRLRSHPRTAAPFESPP